MPFAQVPGDLALDYDGKNLRYSSGPELVRDRLQVAFGLGRGAYALDQNKGFPYMSIFGLRGEDELGIAQMIFTKWLLSFDFVSAVENVRAEFDAETRHYTFNFTVFSDEERVEGSYNFGIG